MQGAFNAGQSSHHGLDRVIFLIVVADILFVPFLLPIPVPLSFAMLLPWFFTLRGIPRTGIFLTALVGAGFAALSFLLGYDPRLGGSDVGIERMANTAIMVFMFVGFLFANTTRVGDNTAVFKLLRAYLFFVFALAALFFVSPSTYFSIRTFWSFGDAVEIAEELTVLTRFTGIMSDPNNLAVSTCAVAAFLVFFQPWLIRKNMVVMVMTAVVVIASMSATGAICYAALFAAFIIGSGRSLPRKAAIVVGSGVLVAVVYLLIRDTSVFMLATERVMDSDADSRFSRWELAMDADKFLSTLLVGDGGSIFLHGRDYRPHNGHIHVAYSFGLICYLAFITMFFRVRKLADWRSWFFLAILFVGFTANVGIYEHRFAGIWVILMAMYYKVAIPIRPVVVQRAQAKPAPQYRRPAAVAARHHDTISL